MKIGNVMKVKNIKTNQSKNIKSEITQEQEVLAGLHELPDINEVIKMLWGEDVVERELVEEGEDNG